MYAFIFSVVSKIITMGYKNVNQIVTNPFLFNRLNNSLVEFTLEVHNSLVDNMFGLVDKLYCVVLVEFPVEDLKKN